MSSKIKTALEMQDPLTLILDVGKSNVKLLLINERGEVQFQRVKTNQPIQTQDYTALDVPGIQSWLMESIPGLPCRAQIRRIGITTHGAAFCGINSTSLAIPVMDYEWDGYGEWRGRYQSMVDPFDETGSPHLPQGLNAGLQLYWLKNAKPALWEQVTCWLPYPQYWAWWFTGKAATEVSSLGCHTHLWNPEKKNYASWAQQEGLVQKWAPIRSAWEELGTLRHELIEPLGLNPNCVVHVGLHDSNACLTQHRKAEPEATVISTGTWTVVMTPGLSGALPHLNPAQEQFFNFSIENKPVATARFMGGREFSYLCHGADPALATLPSLDALLQSGWQALANLNPQPKLRYGQVSHLLLNDEVVNDSPEQVPLHLRPTLASMYCAFMTAQILQNLQAQIAFPTTQRYIVEGPFAQNTVYLKVLSALLDKDHFLRPLDELEGTAKGAWLTTRWQSPKNDQSRYEEISPPSFKQLTSLQKRYLEWLTQSRSVQQEHSQP